MFYLALATSLSVSVCVCVLCVPSVCLCVCVCVCCLSWKDYIRGSDGKLTLVTLCSGADHADVVIRQTSVQVFRRFNQDWSKRPETRKLITFHLYNPEKASPSVLIQGHDTMKWAQEEFDRVRCLVHNLDARRADSATCLSECRDLPLVLPDFHGDTTEQKCTHTTPRKSVILSGEEAYRQSLPAHGSPVLLPVQTAAAATSSPLPALVNISTATTSLRRPPPTPWLQQRLPTPWQRPPRKRRPTPPLVWLTRPVH